jgi:hypothetical protein
MSRYDLLEKDAAIEKIIRYVQSVDPAPIWNEWYVGITDDPLRRLYEEHKASYTRSVFVSVDFPRTARAVEKYLIDQYGMDGSPGGSEYPRAIYVFKKLSDTDPPISS